MQTPGEKISGIIDLPFARDIMENMKKTSLFKRYLQAKEILMIPVAHDPLCATIIERAGFKVLGCGGYANSAALLGAPDIELLTLTEMVDAVWRMADAV